MTALVAALSRFEPSERTVPAALRARVVREGDRPFLRCGGEWLTARELDATSDRVAAGLAELGVGRGDRVAVLCFNRQEYIELLFALAKLGAIMVPLNPYLRGEFLAHQLRDSAPRVVVADGIGVEEIASLPPLGLERVVALDADGLDPAPGSETGSVTAPLTSWRELLATASPPPSVDVGPGDLIAIVYTSGTTGPAKGCMLSHGYYTYYAAPWAECGWIQPTDRIFSALPLFHTGGHLVMMFALMLTGASACIEAAFSASTYIERAAEEGATCLFGIGVHAVAILQQPAKTTDADHPFRIAGFPPLDPSLQDDFEQRFATPVIAEGIGQTELTPGLLESVDGPRKRGANGRPCHHVVCDLVDDDGIPVGVEEVGEFVCRPKLADVMFSGYWNRPDATAQSRRGDWHRTGDYMTRDEDGYFTFLDRKADSLRRRGENISSVQVEGAILQHPKVLQAAVSGVPSELVDVEIKASLVLRPGAVLDPGEFFAFIRERVPYFAVPRYLEIRDELPMTSATNRVQKAVLRAEGITGNTIDLEALGHSIGRGERRGPAGETAVLLDSSAT